MKYGWFLAGARWLAYAALLLSIGSFLHLISIVYGSNWGPPELPMIEHWKRLGEISGVIAAAASVAFGFRSWKCWLITVFSLISAFLNFALQVSAMYKS